MGLCVIWLRSPILSLSASISCAMGPRRRRLDVFHHASSSLARSFPLRVDRPHASFSYRAAFPVRCIAASSSSSAFSPLALSPTRVFSSIVFSLSVSCPVSCPLSIPLSLLSRCTSPPRFSVHSSPARLAPLSTISIPAPLPAALLPLPSRAALPLSSFLYSLLPSSLPLPLSPSPTSDTRRPTAIISLPSPCSLSLSLSLSLPVKLFRR